MMRYLLLSVFAVSFFAIVLLPNTFAVTPEMEPYFPINSDFKRTDAGNQDYHTRFLISDIGDISDVWQIDEQELFTKTTKRYDLKGFEKKYEYNIGWAEPRLTTTVGIYKIIPSDGFYSELVGEKTFRNFFKGVIEDKLASATSPNADWHNFDWAKEPPKYLPLKVYPFNVYSIYCDGIEEDFDGGVQNRGEGRTQITIFCQKDDIFFYVLSFGTSPAWNMSDIVTDIAKEIVLRIEEMPPNIIYQSESNSGGCLIATATFGSEMAPQVQFLRELRDNTVLQTESGTSFMTGFNQFYYSFSPYIADYERENPAFKETVKLALTPMLTSLTLLQYADIDSESEMLGYGIGVILLNVGMYFVAPAVLIMTVRKSFQRS